MSCLLAVEGLRCPVCSAELGATQEAVRTGSTQARREGVHFQFPPKLDGNLVDHLVLYLGELQQHLAFDIATGAISGRRNHQRECTGLTG